MVGIWFRPLGAPPQRASSGFGWMIIFSALSACAGGADGAAHPVLDARDASGDAGDPAVVGHPVVGRPDERLLAAPVLERRAFVQAVLRSNPTIESARQGYRAALARVRPAGAL